MVVGGDKNRTSGSIYENTINRRSSAPPMMMMASAATSGAAASSSNKAAAGCCRSSIVGSAPVRSVLEMLPLPVSTPSSTQQPSLPLPTSSRVVRPPLLPKADQTSNLAAMKVTPDSDWILAKILSHDRSTRTYTLSDVDVLSSDDQIYILSDREKRIVPLRGSESNRWVRGNDVYAVYPDTTSFYPATVSTPPFNGYVMVQFANDEDVNGITHEKAVSMAHVMKVPPGGGAN